MGLLDDAIREHLELKRRHGASDEEIAQEEAEALGPARREFPTPPAAADEQSAELPTAEEPEALPDEPAPIGLEPELEPESPPEPEPETEATREPEQPLDDAAPDTGHPAPDTRDAAPDTDPLEETPEFLQDAPEHDRLWFEQKPPRDFDFE
jgi:hypothetical protein